jgi:preprotein translocase subunit SecD
MISILLIVFNGLRFGIEFNGGTQFQIQLERPVSTANEMSKIVNVISRRLDWTGLKDSKVSGWGDQVIIAQIAETDSKTIEFIEASLRKQGKFEATLDGNLLFSGDEIATIFKEPEKGYAVFPSQNGFEWRLPFMLNKTAAERFTRMTFHRCRITAINPDGTKSYDCDKTYFFIDRPENAVMVIPPTLFEKDKQLLLTGVPFENIPVNTSIDELLLNAGIPFFIVDSNFSQEQLESLSNLVKEKKIALVPESISNEIILKLQEIGFKVKKIEESNEVPWVWRATNAKQVISLSEDVTNMEPFVERIEDARVLNEIQIRGFAETNEQGLQELSNLTILLESGSLPIPVASISKETISPLLGKSFLKNAGIIGFIALIVVGIVIFLRYRKWKIVFPIIFTGFSEVIIILGFASLIKWNLDLAAIAGVIAAVGTGVDHQIVITDELLRGTSTIMSFVNRIKNAFFIIFAAAATSIATMAPIILFSFGLGKLVGFAITTIAGVLIGIFISRPAFSEIVKYLLSKEQS